MLYASIKNMMRDADETPKPYEPADFFPDLPTIDFGDPNAVPVVAFEAQLLAAAAARKAKLASESKAAQPAPPKRS